MIGCGLQVRKLPKVNAEEHVRLQAASLTARESDRKPVQQDGAAADAVLEDERFASMFEDPAFSIDRDSRVYRELHPNAGATRAWAVPRGSPSLVCVSIEI